MLKKSSNISHPYLSSGNSAKKAIIVISSNRGLAGGYNSNITKLITNGTIPKEDILIYSVGRKGRDTLARRGYEIKKDYSEVINDPLYKDAIEIGKDVLDAFANNEVGEIYLVYTRFKNTVTHIPTMIKLLPVDTTAADDKSEESSSEENLTLMNYEPKAEEALDMIIPKYMNSLIYGGLVESLASENGARMQAMDSATSNAEDMISDLTLIYNRARQSSITQELTEIIAGASAIS
jgi:F-type H+-transporting ATPase subunit gamma